MAYQGPNGDENWKETAKKVLKTYYQLFFGTQWHQFDKSTDNDIIRAKICFAMHGQPTLNAEKIEMAYTDEQRKNAERILNAIYKVHKESKSPKILIGFIFIYCKEDKKHFSLPLFSVFVGKDKDRDLRNFVDPDGRTYKNWDDWKSNNRLPKLEYCYPKLGFFTCSGDESYQFDYELDPDVDFESSPASRISSMIIGRTDTITAIASIASGIVGIASLFTPLAPAVIITAAVTGATSAGYGAVRGATRLFDKDTHGEGLADFESMTLWLGIAAAPLSFTSSLINTRLIFGAQQCPIFSRSMRSFATFLNLTSSSVCSAMLGMGLENLIDKASKDKVTPLEVMQFSIRVFFFSNTLMQPEVAMSIICQATEMHLKKYMDNLSDEATKEIIYNFVDRNRADGGIRTFHILDANTFFKSLNPNDKIDIGGRKERTSDAEGNVSNINPNSLLTVNEATETDDIYAIYKSNPPEIMDGTGRKIYTSDGDRFGVITVRPKGAKISTMFQKPECHSEYVNKLLNYFKDYAGSIEPIRDAANRLARFMGFREFQGYLIDNEKTIKVHEATTLDPKVHEEIVHHLNMISI